MPAPLRMARKDSGFVAENRAVDMDRRGIGLLGAVALGAAAGIIASPQSGKRVLAARASRNTERIATFTRDSSAKVLDALPDILEIAAHALGSALAVFGQPFRTASPTIRLESAIAASATLCRRAIWVDAHGATLLLHGLVDDDEEWRTADQLARHMSPDGTVRNLLQVRHRAESE
jgi:hypothetical protein